MSEKYDSDAARNRAVEMIEHEGTGSALVKSFGKVEKAVAVLSPGGGFSSWFVPVTVGDRLAGFFEFQPDLTLMRYSSFQRREDSAEGCPEAALWLDESTIRQRFSEHARADEQMGSPFMTWDRVPSRIVRAVMLTAAGGATRILFAAGAFIWEPGDNGFERTGGRVEGSGG